MPAQWETLSFEKLALLLEGRTGLVAKSCEEIICDHECVAKGMWLHLVCLVEILVWYGSVDLSLMDGTVRNWTRESLYCAFIP